MLRAEQYLEAHRDKNVATHGPRDVDEYLRHDGRRSDRKPWQFRQQVDAIQKLFELVGVDWQQNVDWHHWHHWRDSARALKSTYPTVARDCAEVNIPGAEHGMSFATLRKTHAGLLDKLRTAIRRRGFSIKTEQTYLHWTVRFLAFLGEADPLSAQAAKLGRFLDDHRKVSASKKRLP